MLLSHILTDLLGNINAQNRINAVKTARKITGFDPEIDTES